MCKGSEISHKLAWFHWPFFHHVWSHPLSPIPQNGWGFFPSENINPPKAYLIASHLRLEREEDSKSPLVLEFSYCPAFVQPRVQNYCTYAHACTTERARPARARDVASRAIIASRQISNSKLQNQLEEEVHFLLVWRCQPCHLWGNGSVRMGRKR